MIRNSSRKKFNITPQDLASCLDQKNSMIAILQAQVQDLRFNQQKYQRLQQDVYRTKQKHDNLLRDYQLTKLSNHERRDLTAKNCIQLKIQLQHLQKQLQSKTQQLKDFKAQSQQLIEHSSRRQDDITQTQIKCQQLKANNQLLKMQSDRTLSQISMAKQQLQRQRRQNSNINKSYDTIKDKSYKTQSYIRNLLRQQSSLNENLTKKQDQNNYLDNKINQLNNIHALKSSQCAHLQKQIQQSKFFIASKELQYKRIQKQVKQTAKSLTIQKQKMKNILETSQQKKFSLSRMQNEVNQCSQQINYILSKNTEVSNVNNQLKNDMKVCTKHLQNVIKINKCLQIQLNKFKQANLSVIKKLHQPSKQGLVYSLLSNVDMNRNSSTKWNSKLSATGTGTGMGFDNTL